MLRNAVCSLIIHNLHIRLYHQLQIFCYLKVDKNKSQFLEELFFLTDEEMLEALSEVQHLASNPASVVPSVRT